MKNLFGTAFIIKAAVIVLCLQGSGLNRMAFAQGLKPIVTTTKIVKAIEQRDVSLPYHIEASKAEALVLKTKSGDQYKVYRFLLKGGFSNVTSNIRYDWQMIDANTLVIRVYGEQGDAEALSPFEGMVEIEPGIAVNQKVRVLLLKAGRNKFEANVVDLGWL